MLKDHETNIETIIDDFRLRTGVDAAWSRA
jgi:hypothetical protein